MANKKHDILIDMKWPKEIRVSEKNRTEAQKKAWKRFIKKVAEKFIRFIG